MICNAFNIKKDNILNNFYINLIYKIYFIQMSLNPDKVMGYQSNIFNWRIQRGPEIGTGHTPLTITISTNPIKITTTAREKYNLADWKVFQV